jgi:hypothetical protein
MKSEKQWRLNMPIRWIEKPNKDQVHAAYGAADTGPMTVARRSKAKPKDPDQSQGKVED